MRNIRAILDERNIFRKGKLTIGKGNRLLYHTCVRYIFCERFISKANNSDKNSLWGDANFIQSIFNYNLYIYEKFVVYMSNILTRTTLRVASVITGVRSTTIITATILGRTRTRPCSILVISRTLTCHWTSTPATPV